VHTPAICSAVPGTSRATRRAVETSCVTVSCVAAASTRMVESTARRRRPRKTPVCPATVLTPSLTRCGRLDFAIRRRQYTSEDGSKPGSPTAAPIAAIHRTSNRTASAVSRSE
jgi:hypothetical protein